MGMNGTGRARGSHESGRFYAFGELHVALARVCVAHLPTSQSLAVPYQLSYCLWCSPTLAVDASVGRHCNTMGTASTMACMAEALGIALPTNAAIPAADSRRKVLAHMAGRRIVQMVNENLTFDKVVTRESFENAIRALAAIGGYGCVSLRTRTPNGHSLARDEALTHARDAVHGRSTNAVVHLLALAGRLGVKLTLDDFDRLGANVPLLVNLAPAGQFLMEEFYYAGGLPAVLRNLKEAGLLREEARTVSGKTIGEDVASAPSYDPRVIKYVRHPGEWFFVHSVAF